MSKYIRIPTIMQKYALQRSAQKSGEKMPNQLRELCGMYWPRRSVSRMEKMSRATRFVKISKTVRPDHCTISASVNMVADLSPMK